MIGGYETRYAVGLTRKPNQFALHRTHSISAPLPNNSFPQDSQATHSTIDGIVDDEHEADRLENLLRTSKTNELGLL